MHNLKMCVDHVTKEPQLLPPQEYLEKRSVNGFCLGKEKSIAKSIFFFLLKKREERRRYKEKGDIIIEIIVPSISHHPRESSSKITLGRAQLSPSALANH